MSEAIPLSTTLCVENVFVIVSDIFHERFDLVLKGLTSETRDLGDIQWQAERVVLAEEYQSGVLAYLSDTISPVLISAAAALTLVGVSRFNLPSCRHCQYWVDSTSD